MILVLILAAALAQAPDAKKAIDSMLQASRGQSVDALVQAQLPPVDAMLTFSSTNGRAIWLSQTGRTISLGGCPPSRQCSGGGKFQTSACQLEVELDGKQLVLSHRWIGPPTPCRELATYLLAQHASFMNLIEKRQSLLKDAYRGQAYARIVAPGQPKEAKTADGVNLTWSWEGRRYGSCTMVVSAGPDGLVRDVSLSGTTTDCVIRPVLVTPAGSSGSGQP